MRKTDVHMASIKHRTHEWLADHLSWVQYPKREFPREPIPETVFSHLDRRARRITGAIFVALVGIPFLCGAVSGLFQSWTTPVPTSQPSGDSPAKPALQVLTDTDSRRA